jgi:beta-glucosidase
MKTIKFVIILSLLFNFVYARKKKPVYLDETNPIEERVEDALSHMTLNEKIA